MTHPDTKQSTYAAYRRAWREMIERTFDFTSRVEKPSPAATIRAPGMNLTP